MPNFAFMRRWCAAGCGALAVVVLLGGCVSPASLPLGSDMAQVQRQMGLPTAQYGVIPADGLPVRWQYSSQPAGQVVYNIDWDAQGRVQAVTQALDEANFARIAVDQWTKAHALREFGPPYREEGVHSFDGVIWTWRYRNGPWDRLLHLYFDRSGVLRRWHPSDEPRYDRVFDAPMR